MLGAKPLLLVRHALDTERALRGPREWESVPPFRAFLVEWHVAIALDQGMGFPGSESGNDFLRGSVGRPS